MEAIKKIVEQEVGPGKMLQSFGHVYGVNRTSRVKRWFWTLMAVIGVFLFLPWTQNIRSRGTVTTLRQEQRPQEIQSIIPGRIVKWYVKEGDYVKAGDTLVQLADVKDDFLDPQLLQRTTDQINAKRSSVESYKSKADFTARQLEALQQSRDLKLQDYQNKMAQQRMKIKSDSLEVMAAQNDFTIKTEQYRRQKELFDSGLVSLLQLEQRNQAFQESQAKRVAAEMKFNNARQELIRLQIEWNTVGQDYLEKIAKAEADRYQVLSQIATVDGEISKMLNQYENYLIRSGQYYIKAPQDGQVINARKQGLNEMVKEGDQLAVIVPREVQLAVEIFIRPVDLPLIDTGQSVRFIFDGFPAIVFSGWPQASYGIFSGKVTAVETAVSDNGLFRVLAVEDRNAKPWPKELRNGTGAYSISLLKDVPIWYELWRNINGFPPEYYKDTGTTPGKEGGK